MIAEKSVTQPSEGRFQFLLDRAGLMHGLRIDFLETTQGPITMIKHFPEKSRFLFDGALELWTVQTH